MPEIDEGLRAIITLTAETTARAVIKDAIKLHSATCPIAKDYLASKNRLLGGWRTLLALGGFLISILAILIHFVK